MTVDELLAELARVALYIDPEEAHAKADALLLKFIAGVVGDDRVEVAFDKIDKWYA